MEPEEELAVVGVKVEVVATVAVFENTKGIAVRLNREELLMLCEE